MPGSGKRACKSISSFLGKCSLNRHMSDLSADTYHRLSHAVNTPDTPLRKAAVGTKEEIEPQQPPSFTLSSSALRNTVLKPFVSFDTLDVPVCPVTADKVARYDRSGGERLPKAAWIHLEFAPTNTQCSLHTWREAERFSPNSASRRNCKRRSFAVLRKKLLEPLQNPPRQNTQLLYKTL